LKTAASAKKWNVQPAADEAQRALIDGLDWSCHDGTAAAPHIKQAHGQRAPSSEETGTPRRRENPHVWGSRARRRSTRSPYRTPKETPHSRTHHPNYALQGLAVIRAVTFALRSRVHAHRPNLWSMSFVCEAPMTSTGPHEHSQCCAVA
jgi:hypothetical protein